VLTLVETPVTAPIAASLLDEYFAQREATHPGGGYTVTRPDPSRFVRPDGLFGVAEDDQGHVVGCGGVRRLSDVRFEIKHLFVRESARGRGLGRLILEALEQSARELGAEEIVLDTNASLDAANGLYRSLDYSEIPPYNDNPNATTWFLKTL